MWAEGSLPHPDLEVLARPAGLWLLSSSTPGHGEVGFSESYRAGWLL